MNNYLQYDIVIVNLGPTIGSLDHKTIAQVKAVIGDFTAY